MTTEIHYPFQRLFVGERHTICIAGSTIRLVSSSSGQILDTAQLPSSGGCIRGVGVTQDFERVVTTDDSKQLKVWKVHPADDDKPRLELESTRELPKKSSEVHLTPDGSAILASDKFGDVYSYPVQPPHPHIPPIASPEPVLSRSSGKKVKAKEKPTEGNLILGHTSVVTTFLISQDGRFTITGDRDEHIRVSHYPNGYNIEGFCLGHRKFISALHVTCFDPCILISGGGDPDLHVWDWRSGKLNFILPVSHVAKPLAKIRGGRRTFIRRPRLPDGQGLSRKSKRGKGKRAATNQEDEEMAPLADESVDDTASRGGKDTEMKDAEHPPSQNAFFDPEEDSFVIGKIGSLSVAGVNLILFTAVGASGLFYFLYPPTGSRAEVKVVDLKAPVLDFCTRTSQLTSEVEIWATLDGEWSTRLGGTAEASKTVAVIKCLSGELVVGSDEHSEVLLETLNTSARVTASNALAVDSLELYTCLATLPKSKEEEAEGEFVHGGSEIDGDSPRPAKMPTKDDIKKANRAKTREMLSRKLHSQFEGADSEPGTASQNDLELSEGARITPDDRETKKARIDSEQDS